MDGCIICTVMLGKGQWKRMKWKTSQIGLWFRYMGLFFCARLVLTSVTSTVIQGMSLLSLGQTSLVLLLNLVHHLLSLHTKTEDTMFLPRALLRTEHLENYYPTVSCQCPNRSCLLQSSLSKWISFCSGWSVVGIWDSCSGANTLFPCRHGAQGRDRSKDEIMFPLPPAEQQTALYTMLLHNTDCSWHCRAQIRSSPACRAPLLLHTCDPLYGRRSIYGKQGSTFRVIDK